MSKRPFSESSLADRSALEAVSEIMQHAEDLLKAAQALKKELDIGKEADTTSLTSISKKIGPAVESLALRNSGRPGKLKKLENGHSGSIQIPNTLSLTPWLPKDTIRRSYPPLPPILDPVLSRAVFTHAGMVLKPGEMSYERLEWIGDAYLYLISSAFIYQTFPDLPTGRCAQYRETLIKNKTLGKYTVAYGLHEQARFPGDFNLRGGGPSDKNKQKILGDLFEAYVAGAILGDPQGLERVSTWLKSLWSDELSDELNAEFKCRGLKVVHQAPGLESVGQSEQSNIPGCTENAKVRLSQLLGGKGIRIMYRDEGEPKKEKHTGLPWYTVGVYLDGWGAVNCKLGFGSALNKKEAGAKAALMALNNKKVIEPFEQKRADFMKALEAQRTSAPS